MRLMRHACACMRACLPTDAVHAPLPPLPQTLEALALQQMFVPQGVDPLRQEWLDAAGELDQEVSMQVDDDLEREELDENGIPVLSAITRSSSACILDAPGVVQVDNFTVEEEDVEEEPGMPEGPTPTYIPSQLAKQQQQQAVAAPAPAAAGALDPVAPKQAPSLNPVMTLEEEIRLRALPGAGPPSGPKPRSRPGADRMPLALLGDSASSAFALMGLEGLSAEAAATTTPGEGAGGMAALVSRMSLGERLQGSQDDEEGGVVSVPEEADAAAGAAAGGAAAGTTASEAARESQTVATLPGEQQPAPPFPLALPSLAVPPPLALPFHSPPS